MWCFFLNLPKWGRWQHKQGDTVPLTCRCYRGKGASTYLSQSQPTPQNIYANISKRTKKVNTREFEKSLRGLWMRTLLEQKVLYSTRKHPHKPSWEMSPLVTTQPGAGIITIETLYFKSWKELHLIFLLAGAVQTATLTVKCKGR